MRNLDIADSRGRLEQYAGMGLIGGATADLVGALEQGAADEISEGSQATREEAAAVDEASEGAAFDSGTD